MRAETDGSKDTELSERISPANPVPPVFERFPPTFVQVERLELIQRHARLATGEANEHEHALHAIVFGCHRNHVDLRALL